MPSINLAELRARAYELAGRLDDPAAFRAGIRSLMEAYAHRLLRRGPSMAKRGALLAWDVPGVLLRELEAALIPAAAQNPAAALAVADALWADGRLEERSLAADLAGASGRAAEIRIRLDSWLDGMENPELLQSLAARTCRPMRQADAALFRADERRWLESQSSTIRRFGWMALRAWLDEGGTESILTAFEMLTLALRETQPENIRQIASMFADLARITPAETAKWLEDLPPELILRGRALFRAVLPSLAPDLAEELRARMRRP